MGVFFTSDSHYGHKNIAGQTVSNWESGYRNYESVQHMNEALIKSINALVKSEDTLYHLGDWSFGGIENIWLFRKEIKCKNIHFIFGNHDGWIFKNEFLDNCQKNAQSLFASCQNYLELKVPTLKQRIVLCHYAFRVWNGSHKGSIHLYGHSHNSLPGIGKSMDVGFDAHPEFRPFHLDEIIDIMSKRDVNYIDHHDENTN